MDGSAEGRAERKQQKKKLAWFMEAVIGGLPPLRFMEAVIISLLSLPPPPLPD